MSRPLIIKGPCLKSGTEWKAGNKTATTTKVHFHSVEKFDRERSNKNEKKKGYAVSVAIDTSIFVKK